jgi:hypothetical protein
MNRTLIALRLQLVAWPTSIALTWLIVGMSFTANVVVWGAIGDMPADAMTGGLTSAYIMFFLVYIAAMTQVFPFAVSFGITRREFYGAMSLLAVAQAVTYGSLVAGLSVIEGATDGWGVGVKFFAPELIVTGNPVSQLAVYVVPFLFLAHVGMGLGIVYKRWGRNGVYALVTAVVAVAATAVVLISVLGGWDELGRWLQRQSVVSLAVGWPLLVTAILAAAGYRAIRRATP